jgi:hypothetical protein
MNASDKNRSGMRGPVRELRGERVLDATFVGSELGSNLICARMDTQYFFSSLDVA